MSNSSGGACNIPEALFSDDEGETVVKKSKPKGKPSQDDSEFMQLVETTSAKIARRKGRPRTIAASTFDRSLAEVDEMIATGDWDKAKSPHLVALYDRLHFRCYKVEAAELGPAERYNAAMMAANLVRREFDGDFADAATFMKWVWDKEIKDEKWRRENGRFNARRIGYRLMFSGTLLTDYRLYLARKSHNT